MDLPYLFMRANAGDLGASRGERTLLGEPRHFHPGRRSAAECTGGSAGPGQVGLVDQPNTLYAHIWNFGKAAANHVLVEFYWVNPALGIDASSVQLIAQSPYLVTQTEEKVIDDILAILNQNGSTQNSP